MTLKERLQELKGRYVKIGGRRGSGFIFIGLVEDDTIDEINRLGKKCISQLRQKLADYRACLADWDKVVACHLWAKENAEFKKSMATYRNLLFERKKKLETLANTSGVYSRKYRQLKTMYHDTVRTMRNRMESHRTFADTIEEKKKYYEESEALLTEQLEKIHSLIDFEVAEDYMSVDDETYGGRILLVDTWIKGPYWSLSEYDRNQALKKLIS